MIITVALLVHTLWMRSFYECRSPVSTQLSSVIRTVSRWTLGERFGQTSYFVEPNDDRYVSNATTVESQIRRDRETIVYADWQRLAATLDRLAMVILLIGYTMMLFYWSPSTA